MTFSNSKRGSFSSSSRAAPRWPPASRGFSITIASGSRWRRIHLRTSNCTPRASDRMGTSSACGWSCASSGRSSGRPAPTTTASMPHSSARVTDGPYSLTARITLIASSPRPPASACAARISRSSASRFAALMASLAACVAALPGARPRVRSIRSGWWRRRSTDEIVPTPPSAATLPASRWADTPTPMPPCTMGSSARPARRRGARPWASARAIRSEDTSVMAEDRIMGSGAGPEEPLPCQVAPGARSASISLKMLLPSSTGAGSNGPVPLCAACDAGTKRPLRTSNTCTSPSSIT